MNHRAGSEPAIASVAVLALRESPGLRGARDGAVVRLVGAAGKRGDGRRVRALVSADASDEVCAVW
jgi:hypothetical protein